MSLAGRSEQISILRTAIARVEAGGAAVAGDASASLARRRSAFFELAPAAPVDRGAAAGFAMALAARFSRMEGGPTLWIAEDFALSEWGIPYGPGLAAYGLGWRDFTLMRLARRADVWLAMEEAIRARAFAAIIAEPVSLAGADCPNLLRRLTMGARAAGARAILLRPPANERLPFLAPTPMRFEIAARPAPRSSAGRRPLPGRAAWGVRCAGPPGSLPGVDPDVFHPVDLAACLAGEDVLSAALSLRFPARSSLRARAA
jgi:protein ImuA